MCAEWGIPGHVLEEGKCVLQEPQVAMSADEDPHPHYQSSMVIGGRE